ncbi:MULTISPECIES: dihydrofolate reductase family protein [Micrococcaceae]|uniref:dihydrofolate reductase family protein n=1 Tax=Micrococcaceae TaxID=1268 RepID=UPI00161B6D26|nr:MULTISPECIES: dihydrofolate reductase family protein [Micrococcaceae]MBB5750850.1 dihydrofolate reductase [Micrococcus sp. TA1]HRO30822.1 dihydrofolate reductase family protein [Citricoccus sp.]HRO92401.1 dihydrofolate reductase family protein [Citricoccus sp.]
MAVIYETACTLNGFLATEDDSLDWLFAIPGEQPDLTPFMESATAIVMGSTTYEWVLEHEDLMAHPEQWPEYLGRQPLFVFSSRELPVPEGADVRVLDGDVGRHLPEIRAAAGAGDIWMMGGGRLAAQFLEADALDRVCLTLAPVTLASGKPLFAGDARWDRLRLRSAEKIGEWARLVYDVTPSSSRGS